MKNTNTLVTVQYLTSRNAEPHLKLPSAMGFCTPESFSYGQRS